MIIFDVQSAVYGVGSGNAPALHVERRTPNDGFLFIPNLHVTRPCPPSPSHLTGQNNPTKTRQQQQSRFPYPTGRGS